MAAMIPAGPPASVAAISGQVAVGARRHRNNCADPMAMLVNTAAT
jgi:hypothetical protein